MVYYKYTKYGNKEELETSEADFDSWLRIKNLLWWYVFGSARRKRGF